MDERSHNEEIDKSKEQSQPVTQQSIEPGASISTSNDVKEVDGPKLGSERSLTSKVWTDFKKVKIDGQWKAVCEHCNWKLRGDARAGTTHLHAHLKSCKRKRCSDIKQSVLKMGKEGSGKTLIGSALNFDQEDSRLKLARMILMHELPFRLTEFIGFKEYSSSLQPLFRMSTRNTIRSDIMKLYDHEKSRMKKMFHNNSSRVAITTDIWTSNQRKGFMAITAHYIDDSWSLQSRIIKDVLAIPISTVASESAFSTSGRVISDHRSRLRPNTIKALMCIQNWIWSEYTDTRMSTDILAQYCDLFNDEDGDGDAMDLNLPGED